jgi:hypothetical protein
MLGKQSSKYTINLDGDLVGGFYQPLNMPRSLGGMMKGRVLALTPKDQTRSYTYFLRSLGSSKSEISGNPKWP